MKDLIELGTVTDELARQLPQFVLQRKNILICGGTGSGKTTLANGLMQFIPNDERIVLIEDTAEIQIQKENVVRFEARREQNGLPAITIRDLLKATLRHRPDRIIVGEIRGGEAFDLLQLLNTGHSGTISTVHANSSAQGISRFTTCVLQSGIEMPYAAIKANIAESLNIIIQIDRRPGYRFVSEVLEIQSYKPEQDRYELRNLYRLSDELTERHSRSAESSLKFLAET
jgi:pilus assembly protein CpaF